ncbi:MAG TPA: hypothetical protein VL360_08750 [Gammaproteobacteria bacterium]|jgi:uncharacterized membrane protein YcjF (UPF0283 family)|nr:hypothetical protein [Gammaproteobacteria bacterium]
MKSTRDIQISLSLEEKNAELEAQIAAERNQDMQNIQREMNDLQAIMSDINVQVLDQAPKVDAIENNAENAAKKTENAVQILEEAQTKQSTRRKRIATIVIVLLSLALVIGGGVLISAALGMSGTVGFIVGAAIMLGGMAVVAGIGYGIYSLFKRCMRKPNDHADHPDEPASKNINHKKPRPASNNTNDVTNSLRDKNGAEAEPSLMRRGVDAAINSGVAKHALTALPSLAASTLTSRQTDNPDSLDTGSTITNFLL